MNFFSSDAFLDSLARALFPERRASFEVCRVSGRGFRLLVIDGRRVISEVPFLDFVEPVSGEHPGRRPVRYLRNAVLETIPAEQWSQPSPGLELEPAPFTEWSRFDSWKGFESWVGRNGWSSDVPRKRRRIERDLGPVSFTFHDLRPEVLERLFAWKSAQYVASGYVDHFLDPRWRRFFENLNGHGALILSSLRGGDRLLAVHAGMRFGGRFCYWMPAHDPELFRYSPGKVLLHELMQRSQADGDAEFDFLIGGEPYKFQYATHVRVIGPIGIEPWSLTLQKVVRRELRAALQRAPALEQRIDSWRREVRDWRSRQVPMKEAVRSLAQHLWCLGSGLGEGRGRQTHESAQDRVAGGRSPVAEEIPPAVVGPDGVRDAGGSGRQLCDPSPDGVRAGPDLPRARPA